MVKRLTSYKALTGFISKNNCFQISGNRLFCNICNKLIHYNSKEGVKPLNIRIGSKSHKTKKLLGNNQRRLDFTIEDPEAV